MSERRVVVTDPAGLHARQAARVVRLASPFSSRITIRHEGREADARSLIGILGLAVGPATEITLVAEGPDSDEALRAVALGLAPESPDRVPEPPAPGAGPAHGPSSNDQPETGRRHP